VTSVVPGAKCDSDIPQADIPVGSGSGKTYGIHWNSLAGMCGAYLSNHEQEPELIEQRAR
jgi:hypothetical protein